MSWSNRTPSIIERVNNNGSHRFLALLIEIYHENLQQIEIYHVILQQTWILEYFLLKWWISIKKLSSKIKEYDSSKLKEIDKKENWGYLDLIMGPRVKCVGIHEFI